MLNRAGETSDAGETGSPRIEILYFEGCPGFVKALSAVEEALALAGLPVTVVLQRPSGPDEHPGSLSKSPGSPTVLVDGEDLFPQTGDTSCDSCRIYATPRGLRDHPTVEMVREALEKRMAAAGDRR